MKAVSTVGGLLLRSARRWPDSPALVEEQTVLTHRQAAARVGRADADGYVQVLDRMKDMIIRGGENIYSLEVESVLARHPAIAEVAVVGVPDPVMGERVRAVAVLGAGQFLALGALREWAGTQLADYKLPAELVTVGSLARNASGKVMKKQLAAQPAAAAPPSASART
jgi:acyl-CoA synthetase (AMP-forming)/AMP-acid ligase II